MQALCDIQTLVCHTNDRFFHPDPAAKETLLNALIQQADVIAGAVADAAASVAPPAVRGEISLLLGRAHDCTTEYSAAAERHLTAAVRLRPDDPASWTALAHCLFKKREVDVAETCLRESIRIAPTSEACRLLAQLLRSADFGGGPERARESREAAAAAVRADATDYRAWLGTATGFLTHFMSSPTRDTELLERALQAYQQAATLEASGGHAKATASAPRELAAPAARPPGGDGASAGSGGGGCGSSEGAGGDDGSAGAADAAAVRLSASAASTCEAALATARAAVAAASSTAGGGGRVASADPDLHYNWAGALALAQEFGSALRRFATVRATGDPSLNPQADMAAIVAHVRRVAAEMAPERLASGPAALKGRRLHALAASCTLPSILSAGSPSGAAMLGGRRPSTLAGLSFGKNAGNYVVLRPVLPLRGRDAPPWLVLAVDSDKTTTCVAVHHLASASVAKLSERNLLVLLDPVRQRVGLTAADEALVEGDVAAASPAGSELPSTCADDLSYAFESVSVLTSEHFLVDGARGFN